MRYAGRADVSLFGPIRHERAYYHGCVCGGHCPSDAEFGFVERVTPAATELVSQHGALSSVDEATRSLHRSAGRRLSASTVRRVTERVGRETFGPERHAESETHADPES